MMVNLKSARELKPKNLNKEGLPLHSAKMNNHNSRNKVSLKFQYTNKQMILYNSKEKENGRKKLKQKNLSQILLKFKKKMISNLKKYNVNEDMYNKKIINDIIYDENKHIVSEFKNYLLWDENSDFLKRFYYLHESINRLPKINYYYETYTLFPPVYFCLDDLVKIMIKNVKRKKKYLEMIEEMEDNNDNSFKKEEKKEFKQIINPKDISNTMTFDPSTINNIEINSFLNQNENDNNNLKDFDQIVNFILNDNENESIVDNKKNKKNNSHEKKNSFINNNDNSLFSLNLDLENKKNKEEDLRGNIIKKIDHSQKTIIPKIGKILEVKKLNFQNLNQEINKENNNQTSNKKKENKPHLIKNNSNNKLCKIAYSDRHKKTIENLKSENKNITIKKTIIKKSPVKKILINKKLNEQIPISERMSSSKKEIKTNDKDKLNKSIEKMMKMIQYSQTSSRSVTNNNSKIKSKTQNKAKKLQIETNSKKKYKKIISNKTITKLEEKENKKSNLSNKKILVNKLLITSPNIIQTETTPSSFITNNNITSSIYNINLNLNLGHNSTSYNNNYNNTNNNLISNKSVLTKRNSNYTIVNPLLNKGNSVLHSENKNIVKRKQYNIRNVIHNNDNSIPITNPLSKYSTLFKSKNLNTERTINNNNNQKDKISYDLNGNNVHINIQKQSIYNTIGYDNGNYSNSSVNININCNNNIENNNSNSEKIYSRNDVSASLLNNLKNSYSNRAKKKLVFQISEMKYSKSSKRLSTQNYKNNDFKTIIHDYKYTKIDKIKKKNKDKKYPLTSRNETKIHDDLISKILKKTNK